MLALKKEEENAKKGYEFQYLDVNHPGIFPNFKTKETNEKFFQWGLQDNIQLMKYRFNKSFQPIQAEEFLKDLMNDKQVIKSFQPLGSLTPGTCTEVKFTQMNCNVLNTSFFDVFRDIGIVYGEEG